VWVAPDGARVNVDDFAPSPDGKTLVMTGLAQKSGMKCVWVLQPTAR
jgi:hypothetical protein